MSNRKVELLAPAGNFSCFRAAINAGADAVYLGGEKFGARAYADNFTTDEIISAIKIAHIFDKKVYLTVNTLVKENEFSELIPYITPFYEAGLDGVIIQDIGVLETIRNNFPYLELHASTQMTITGSYGASYLKKLGVCRVVPARELSLKEIKKIKTETGLEIECFIHGAMCYAYSGQCLFSSILGGRSGNRGRCAGPCRLPYADDTGNTIYPLSLKDMYTLPIIPELIEAGIDSFKIEGRMKSPEYVAGVTAMYRKYIDLYMSNPGKPYKVELKDEKLIKELYIRSDICNGYYKKHNDKAMITLGKPGYSGNSQAVIESIHEKYISKNILLPITGYVRIFSGEPSVITLSSEKASVTVTGDIVSPALKRPLEETEIAKRIGKMGDTCFELTDLCVDTDNASFMPVQTLNELRRIACSKLENEIINLVKPHEVKGVYNIEQKCCKSEYASMYSNSLCAFATTKQQLEVINDFDEIKLVYVDADIFLADNSNEKLLLNKKEYFIALPHIFRNRSYKYTAEYQKLLGNKCIKGVLVRNIEEYEWLNSVNYNGRVISDYSIYTWNNSALSFCLERFDRVTLPLELNKRELAALNEVKNSEFVIYGYIPLMYSANCVRNTLKKCIYDVSGKQNIYHLTDRYNNVFTIVQNCIHCYNILYNTVPLSLHGQMDSISKKDYNILRIDFSIENTEQTRKVIEYFLGKNTEFPFKDFTNGHYKRGVE